MELFYTENISDKIILDAFESKHIARVLRLQAGAQLHFTNGEGSLFKCELIDANPKKCICNLLEKTHKMPKHPYYMHIAIAPTKNIDRFEWFLEKSVEIGIDEITPLLTDNSERKHIKPERLNKRIVAAMKQSHKYYLPKLNPLTKYKDFIQTGFDGCKTIAHCHKGAKKPLKKLVAEKNKILTLIGPEGDFSEKEVELAIQKGFTATSLGEYRLRTETAGIVASHTVALMHS